MTGTLRPLWAEYDEDALAQNLAFVRRLAGGRRLIASVKANGYGHGAVAMAEALARQGVDTLWTGSIDDALAIRAAGNKARIILFAGPLPSDMPAVLAQDLTPTIHDRAGAEAVAAAARQPTPIYLKVDAGLGRLGVPLEEAAGLIEAIAGMRNVVIEGIYTHLPFGTAAGRDWAAGRYAGFAALLRRLTGRGIRPAVTQAWASSGLLAGLPDDSNAVCVGHLLYGLSPVDADVAGAGALRPVLSAIKTRLIHVVRHAAGRDAAIGGQYGQRNARLSGVVPLGLGDGMRNAAAGETASLILRGRRVLILAVSLEHTTLDLTGVDEAAVGDEVIVVGGSDGLANGFRDFARWFGCSELEAVMGFSGRLAARQPRA